MIKKLSIILYPFGNKVWNRLQADEFEREGEVRLSSAANNPDSNSIAEPTLTALEAEVCLSLFIAGHQNLSILLSLTLLLISKLFSLY